MCGRAPANGPTDAALAIRVTRREGLEKHLLGEIGRIFRVAAARVKIAVDTGQVAGVAVFERGRRGKIRRRRHRGGRRRVWSDPYPR